MEINTTKRKRSADFPIKFIDGYIQGWAFKVGECFKPALDIYYTPRIKNNVTNMEWTQGTPPKYCFSVGDTFNHSIEKDLVIQVAYISPDLKLSVSVYMGNKKIDTIEATQNDFVGILKEDNLYFFSKKHQEKPC